MECDMKKKSVSRRPFWWTVLFLLLIFCAVDLALLAGFNLLLDLLSAVVSSASAPSEAVAAQNGINALFRQFILFGLPASGLLFILFMVPSRLSCRTKKLSPVIPRKAFWVNSLLLLVAVCVLDFTLWGGIYLVGDILSPVLTSASASPEISRAIDGFHALVHNFYWLALPASLIFFLLALVVLGLACRSNKSPKTDKAAPKPCPKKSAAQESQSAIAERRLREQRLFLHLMSVLQREGRLIDFFAEDLDAYDDAQIGAAVREIHGTCRRVVEKSLSLKPVIQKIEGESVTVPPGFDPGAVKLVGNVTGEPPFTGKLRHRGWMAGKLEMPTFSGSQDPSILAPAEVEIE